MRIFPQTAEGWSALATVVSALVAFLNVVLVGLVVRYTAKQTGILKNQADIATRQSMLSISEQKLRFYHDMDIAIRALVQTMENIRRVQLHLLNGTLCDGQTDSVRPPEWSACSSFLSVYHPTTEILLDEIDVELALLDSTIMEYKQHDSSEKGREIKLRIDASIDKITAHLLKATSSRKVSR